MSGANLVLGYEDFENALKSWQILTNTIEPSTFGFYTTEFLPLFSSKTDNAKRSCELPNEEFIFLLYDKTFFGKCDFCTVVGRYGIYSCEEYKTHYYNGKKNNFVSWEKFLRTGLFSRHKERIFLDGEYVINGFTNSKKLFLLLNELRVYLSSCYPYYFLTPCYTVPIGDIRLATDELQNVFEKAEKFLQKEKDKKCFFHKKQFETEPVKTILKCSQSSAEDIFMLYRREKHIAVITSWGVEAYEYNKKKQTSKKHTLTNWKELLRCQSLLETERKIYVEGRFVCSSNQAMYHILMNLHILLGSKYIQKVTPPPSYDEIRSTLNASQTISSGFKNFNTQIYFKEPISITPPIARRNRKPSRSSGALKEKEKKREPKEVILGGKMVETIEESVTIESEPEFSLPKTKGFELEQLTQVISFNNLCFVDPPPYPSD